MDKSAEYPAHEGNCEGGPARRKADERGIDHQLHPPQWKGGSDGGDQLRDGFRRAHR
jgi:hypothetical protein